MAGKLTGADKEIKQLDFLCPLCNTSNSSIGHLTEHLKNVHKPLTELGPSSKCDNRLRLSPKQKEELIKVVPKNRYKSMEHKYSLIRNIVAPESAIAADKITPPSDKEHVKPPIPDLRSWNLQEYLDGQIEAIINIFMVIEGNEKETVIQRFEALVHTLRIANENGAARNGLPRRPGPVLTVTQPAPAYSFPIPDPPILGLVAEASSCPPNSDQIFMAFDPAVKWQSSEWPGDGVLDPKILEQDD